MNFRSPSRCVDINIRSFKGAYKLFSKILKPSEFSDVACATPQHQDAALVSFVGRLASEMSVDDGPIFQEITNCWVVVGAKDVLPALEMGIRFTKCGETSCIWSNAKFAYGPGTRGKVLEAHSHVRYEVTVHKVKSSEEIETDNPAKIELCRSKKSIANDIYRNENIRTNSHSRDRALQIYKHAADFLEFLVEKPPAKPDYDVAEARELLLDCLNNIAAVHLHCKFYHAAKESCVAVLTIEPKNFKALLRAAKAALLDPASSYEEVDAAISAASELCEDNEKLQTDVELLKADFLSRMHAHEKKEKSMYSRMAKATVQSSKKEWIKTETQLSSKEGEVDEPTNASPGKSFAYVKELSWRLILPYAFQLVLPFITYYFFCMARKEKKSNPNVYAEIPRRQENEL